MIKLSLTIPLFFLIFIDAMGLAIVAPILAPALFTEPVQVLGQYSLLSRQIIYAVLLSLYSWLMLYSSPLIGSLSDQLGRKRILNFCLIGIMVGYFLLALGLRYDSLLLLIIGRSVCGLTAGSQAVALAAVLDNIDSAKENVYINMCLLASSLGFFIGPMIAGYLSNPDIVSWFQYETPFYFVFFLALFNLLLLQISYGKLVADKNMTIATIKMLKGMDHLLDGFRNAKIRKMIIPFLFMQMGWGAYFLFLPIYLVGKFHFHAMQTGLFMSLLGLGFCLTYGIISPVLTKKLGIKKIILIGVWGAGVSVLCLLCFNHRLFLWMFGMLSAIFICLGLSAFITLFVDSIETKQRGWILGIVTATVSFSFGVITLISGFLTTVSLILPMIAAVFCLLLSGLLVKIHNNG